MLFSVLVPVYNVEKYLEECIDSIISQTEQDYEIVLIDDGSTDSSGMLCDSFAERYPDRITVKHNKNQGSILTRVELIKSAQGDYLVHLDSDDTLRLDALSLLKKSIDKYKPDMVIYGLHRIGLDGTSTAQVMKNVSMLYEGRNKVDLYKTMCSTSQLNNYVTKVVRRELALSSEFFLNYHHVTMGDDLLQSLPLMTNARSIFYLAEPLYNYRKNIGSLTLGGVRNRYESENIVFSELIRYSEIWGIYDEMYPIIQNRYISMCLDVLSVSTIKEQLTGKYIQLFHQISQDKLFVSSKNTIDYFPMWKKTLWKLVATDNLYAFSIVWWIIRNMSRLKISLMR